MRRALIWLLVLMTMVAAGAAARASVITVSSEVCTAVASLGEAPPGVAYQPGVDAEGRAVAPADLPGTADPTLAQKLAATPIEITVGLRRRFGIPADASLFRGRAEIGYLTVHDGRAYLDGVPLAPSEEALLRAACAGGRRR